MKNPWKAPRLPSEHGRAVLHVALQAGSGPRAIHFAHRALEKVVGRLAAGSVAYQVGVTGKWGVETSAQVVLVNGAWWAVPWSTFTRRVKALGRALAIELAQEQVLLETWGPTGTYRSEVFVNVRARQQRGALRRSGIAASRAVGHRQP
jgi:hypothetical protein